MIPPDSLFRGMLSLVTTSNMDYVQINSEPLEMITVLLAERQTLMKSVIEAMERTKSGYPCIACLTTQQDVVEALEDCETLADGLSALLRLQDRPYQHQHQESP